MIKVREVNPVSGKIEWGPWCTLNAPVQLCVDVVDACKVKPKGEDNGKGK